MRASLCCLLRYGDPDTPRLEDAADDPEEADGDQGAVRLADHLPGDELQRAEGDVEEDRAVHDVADGVRDDHRHQPEALPHRRVDGEVRQFTEEEGDPAGEGELLRDEGGEARADQDGEHRPPAPERVLHEVAELEAEAGEEDARRGHQPQPDRDDAEPLDRPVCPDDRCHISRKQEIADRAPVERHPSGSLATRALAVMAIPPRGFWTTVVRTQWAAHASMMSRAICAANASPKMPALRNCWR